MSGYTADKIAHHGVLDPETDFIQKPFTPKQLSGKVREILKRPPWHSGAHLDATASQPGGID
jgi:DNA-binding response OmpR family regulator